MNIYYHLNSNYTSLNYANSNHENSNYISSIYNESTEKKSIRDEPASNESNCNESTATSQTENLLKRVLAISENCLKNVQLLQSTLEKNSNLTFNQIQIIQHFINAHLENLLSSAVMQQVDLHLRPRLTGLPVPFEVSKEGEVILPLKSHGKKLGKGNFREVKVGIALSHPQFPIIACSTQTFKLLIAKDYSNSEIRILKKIAYFLKAYPSMKGILKFYGFMDYQPKSVENPHVFPRGYEELLTSNEINEKRSLASKLYNHGNLQDSLQTLNFRNRAFITMYILQGLTYLHKMKIFHSDLKADNIFLEIDQDSGNITDAVIADFGFACDLTNPEDRFFKNGCINYRAPELLSDRPLRGLPIDESILACDVYSMGLLLKELFSNYPNSKADEIIDSMLFIDPSTRPHARDALLSFRTLFKG